jgi:ribonuclease P protein subunit POP4
MITPKNILIHELIGLKVRVLDACNKSLIGIEGKVIDETKNMLIIEVNMHLTKRVQKKGTRFMFELPDGTKVAVDGNKLSGRPYERIKSKIKKW